MIHILFSYKQERLARTDFVKLLKSLPYHIQHEIEQFQRWEDAQSGLLGKLLLVKGLEVTGADPELINTLTRSPESRPFFKTSPVDFNIAHSGDYTLCVISDNCRVGVDVEKVRPVNIAEYEREFSPDEWTMLESQSFSYRTFFELWTKKEAVVKGDGSGLGKPLAEVDVRHTPAILNGASWYLHRIDLHGEYVAHVAINAADAELRMHPVNF